MLCVTVGALAAFVCFHLGAETDIYPMVLAMAAAVGGIGAGIVWERWPRERSP